MRHRPLSSPWLPFGVPGNSGAQTCLVLFHHAGGGATFFRGWPDHELLKGVDVYRMEMPGRGSRFRDPPCSNFTDLLIELAPVLTDLADRYADVVLFGHSLGSLLAFEAALHLQEIKRQPQALIVSARRAPHLPTPQPWRHRMTDRALTEELRRLGGTQEEVLANEELLQLFLPMIRTDFQLTESYRPCRPTKILSPVLALRGKADAEVSEADIEAWEEIAADRFECRSYDGDHFYLSEPTNLHQLLNDLTRFRTGLCLPFPAGGPI
ncbi:alpha/beta fold hydrolase [Rhizobium sp. FKY42]|uniref:thioesterase II family protein n=1 Tax=Rhizobium sp. FKY42 TaxID=2562310 RepID=UPI00148554F5|nr:alpha/beta fold hydrolase [Rhizobium sp. FKY42]